jgi:catechol-2,3-dioxygenase
MGISHIDLTVTDYERTARWYEDVLGFALLNKHRDETFDATTMIHSSGAIVNLQTHHTTERSDVFDERRVGLDHLAFRVADRDELQQWVSHFDAMGVGHSGIIDAPHGPTLVFRDPDNFQLELFVHLPPNERVELHR